MSNNLHSELSELIRELSLISLNVKGDTKRILNSAVKPLTYAIFAAAPHGKVVHKRYSTVKLNKRIKTQKGKGNAVATYRPGNLAASFTQLDKKSKFSVLIGAKLAKGSVTGEFGPFTRQDGYYAHMVERGTINSKAQPFVEPTWNIMKPSIELNIIAQMKKRIKRLKK